MVLIEFIVLPPWPITLGISSLDTITSINTVLSSSDSNSFTDTDSLSFTNPLMISSVKLSGILP